MVAYCALHGVTLAQTYADEGLSGKRADNRPGLQQAIAHACESHGVLVVYSLSRLARSTRDAIDIAERLAKSGADLVSITEKIDTTTSMGRFFFTTIAALAQLERDQISERTCMALAHKRSKRQRVSGHIPYGSRLADDGVNLLDEPQEQRAVAVNAELKRLAAPGQPGNAGGEMAAVQERIRVAEQRATEVGVEIAVLGRDLVDEGEVRAALSMFAPVWETLSPREQARIVRLLVERVDYDGGKGTIAVTFRPSGIKTLAGEARQISEVAA